MIVVAGVAALAAWGYTYAAYPALLALFGRRRRTAYGEFPPDAWPSVTIVIPVHNAARTIADTLRQVLALDYPADRRQILVASDASTDETDTIAGAFAGLGVEFLRLPMRAGKTATEGAAGLRARGDIVVNVDAGTRLRRDALKALIAPFADPSVGVVSGRDASLARVGDARAAGEAWYVRYEMWVRDLETRAWGLVGASGCFFAIRAPLYKESLPPALSRDFAAALVAREHGLRAVSASGAVCGIQTSQGTVQEYRRKVRTMARGLATLWHKRALLNPFRYDVFAWMLWSHKVCRWLVPWTVPLVGAALVWDAAAGDPARWVGLGFKGLMLGGVVLLLAGRRLAAAIGYAVLGTVAALHAWCRALTGSSFGVWEPTRRAA